MKFVRATSIPTTPEANTFYMITQSTNKVKFYVTGAASTVLRGVDATFDRYDLLLQDTSGTLDASVAQVFSISNTTAGTRTLSFANLPTNRAMVLVLKIIGKAGTIVFPANIQWSDGKAPVLGSNNSLIVIYSDGLTIMGNQGPTY